VLQAGVDADTALTKQKKPHPYLIGGEASAVVDHKIRLAKLCQLGTAAGTAQHSTAQHGTCSVEGTILHLR
jgi:hypothetical protein